MRSRRGRGQALVLVALTISFAILSTQAYIYQRSKTRSSTGYSILSDYVLGIEQGVRHVVVASLLEEGWLFGWDKRVKFTIDHNDIDSDLSNFSVLIHLSTSAGRNNDDVSFIFDELQSDNNRRKIAVTTCDGMTQCYMEIEKWDDSSEEAWLWVKVPSLNSTSYTDLYLYYDRFHVNNTDYVGDTGSVPAQNVWDGNFVVVQHLDDLTRSTTDDSTSNNNDGTKRRRDSPEEAPGIIGDCQDFDGRRDYITFPTYFTAGQSEVTLELWMNRDRWDIDRTIYDAYDRRNWQFSLLEGKWYTRDTSTGSSGTRDNDVDWNDPGTGWHYIALRYSVSESIKALYVDGSPGPSTSYSIDTLTTERDDERLGYATDGEEFDGKIDEFRISTGIARNASWIKASYESGRDHLVDFGSEEIKEDTYNGWATSNFDHNLDRWASFVGEDYRFGRCDFNATVASQSPYSDGVWLSWGTDGRGVSSAYADFTMNISGRDVEVDWSFSVNITAMVLVSGSYSQGAGDSKQVTAILNHFNEGESALAGTITLTYLKEGVWSDPAGLGGYLWQDFGNGTYRYTFTDEISGGLVQIHVQACDRRGIFVQAVASLPEG